MNIPILHMRNGGLEEKVSKDLGVSKEQSQNVNPGSSDPELQNWGMGSEGGLLGGIRLLRQILSEHIVISVILTADAMVYIFLNNLPYFSKIKMHTQK